MNQRQRNLILTDIEAFCKDFFIWYVGRGLGWEKLGLSWDQVFSIPTHPNWECSKLLPCLSPNMQYATIRNRKWLDVLKKINKKKLLRAIIVQYHKTALQHYTEIRDGVFNVGWFKAARGERGWCWTLKPELHMSWTVIVVSYSESGSNTIKNYLFYKSRINKNPIPEAANTSHEKVICTYSPICV